MILVGIEVKEFAYICLVLEGGDFFCDLLRVLPNYIP